MEGLDERKIFEEFVTAGREEQSVYVHGERPRRLIVNIFPHTRKETSARRLHDALFEVLPPDIYDQLKERMNGQSQD